MNVIKEINRINEHETRKGTDISASWHAQYKNSPYIFVGGLPYDLNEGDIITLFSQYGYIKDINLVRNKKSGKSQGYAFLAYEQIPSAVLAVDNFNGIKILNREIRVDHAANYKKEKKKDEEKDGKEKKVEEDKDGKEKTDEEEKDGKEQTLSGKKKKKRRYGPN